MDLLRRNYEIKLHRRKLLSGFGKKIVINIRDDSQAEFCAMDCSAAIVSRTAAIV